MNWTSLLKPGGKLNEFIITGKHEEKQKAIESLMTIAQFVDRYNELSPSQKESINEVLLGIRKEPVTPSKQVGKKSSPPSNLFKNIVALASKSSTLPILENVIICTDGRVIAANLEVFTSTKLPNYSAPDDIAVPGKLLKGLKETDILSSKYDKATGQAILKTTKGDMKFGAHDPSEFPKPAQMDVTHESVKEFELTQAMIDEIKTYLSFCGNDDLRPVMNGVYVTPESIVSTDAHRLKWERKETGVPMPILIDKNMVKYLVPGKYITNGLNLHSINEKDNCSIRLIDGKYPNWEAVIPDKKSRTHTVVLERDKLIQNLQMLSKVWNKITCQVRLDFVTGNMSAQDLDFNNEMTLPIPVISKDEKVPEPYTDAKGVKVIPKPTGNFEIGFNGNFLWEILKHKSSPEVSLEMIAPNKCGIIDDMFLIMPVMLKD